MLGLLLFFAQVVHAPERSREVQSLVDEARSLPPELSADALLRIASHKLPSDPAWRGDLIEEAFTTGARAPAPFPHTQDLRQTGLERLVLQTRAVEAMLALNAARALALFRDIPIPDPPPLSCQGRLTPDLSSFYQTALHLFESAFTDVERVKGDDTRFLERILSSTQSPSQIVPALKMMPDAGARMTPDQRRQFADLLAGVLDRVNGSDREFSASENVLVPSALAEMHDSQMFVPALRSYIARHVSGVRCSDFDPARGASESVRQFNALIGRLSPTTAQLRPITADEAKPSRRDGVSR